MQRIATHRLMWGPIALGTAVLVAPVRRHRAVWTVSVGSTARRRRVVRGGHYVPSARAALEGLRVSDRRPDAEWLSGLGVALIGFGLTLHVRAPLDARLSPLSEGGTVRAKRGRGGFAPLDALTTFAGVGPPAPQGDNHRTIYMAPSRPRGVRPSLRSAGDNVIPSQYG
jgi:hypothetical protein